MARRTMVMYSMRFHGRLDKDATVLPSDINGENLLDLFELWRDSLEDGLVPRKGSDDWTRVLSMERCPISGDSLLISVQTGKSGEKGEVVDPPTGSTLYSFEADAVTAVKARIFVTVPSRSPVALMCVEHIVHGGGDTRVLSSFAHFMSKYRDEVTMDRAAVFMPGTLEESFKAMESLEVRVYASPDDVGSDVVESTAYVAHRLVHQKRKPFSLNLFRRILGNPAIAGRLVGVEAPIQEKDVYVTLKDVNGGSRKFSLNDELDTKFREVLNESQEPPLNDAEFIGRCRSCGRAYLEALGAV